MSSTLESRLAEVVGKVPATRGSGLQDELWANLVWSCFMASCVLPVNKVWTRGGEFRRQPLRRSFSLLLLASPFLLLSSFFPLSFLFLSSFYPLYSSSFYPLSILFILLLSSSFFFFLLLSSSFFFFLLLSSSFFFFLLLSSSLFFSLLLCSSLLICFSSHSHKLPKDHTLLAKRTLNICIGCSPPFGMPTGYACTWSHHGPVPLMRMMPWTQCLASRAHIYLSAPLCIFVLRTWLHSRRFIPCSTMLQQWHNQQQLQRLNKRLLKTPAKSEIHPLVCQPQWLAELSLAKLSFWLRAR